MRGMQIVLPGALPDASIAHELASHFEKNAPHFVAWLSRAHAKTIPASPADTLCTPFEYWILERHGFKPGSQERASAGLAAAYALTSGVRAAPDQPLWLAQLVHVSPARDGAALIPANELEIEPEESDALYEAAAEFFEGSGFTAEPFDTMHWRLSPPSDYRPQAASPALVSITAVNDWWTQDTAGRPWRRLVNELQMLWFDHPVNQARENRGLRPINSLWMYGGAEPSRLRPVSQVDDPRVLRSLQGPALVQDWGRWLQEIQQLDAEIFHALTPEDHIVMTGNDRIVELHAGRPGLLAGLFGRKKDWRSWWSSRN